MRSFIHSFIRLLNLSTRNQKNHEKRKKERKGHRPPTSIGIKKTSLITLSCGVKISVVRLFLLSQSTRVTDGQTYKQNYDRQDRASIAASRGKICMILTSAVLSQYTRVTADRQTTADILWQ